VQGTWAALIPYTDIYYQRCWDGVPEFWRFREWKREFDDYVSHNSLPSMMLLWMPGDHLGSFDKSLDGVDTPETQMADNDYAVGGLIETAASSPYAKDTLIITIEDDASDGPDHVDAQRSVALFSGAYVRHHAVVSSRYTTVNVVKTIEEILGIGPIGLNDALAAPMSDVFDANATSWTYKAIVPDVLRSTKLPLPRDEHAKAAFPRRSAAYWTKATAGQDFSGPDRIDPISFNRALWRGLKGAEPYPVTPTGGGPSPKAVVGH
jgi:DNA-binding beta-propeller fold protein YncE